MGSTTRGPKAKIELKLVLRQVRFLPGRKHFNFLIGQKVMTSSQRFFNPRCYDGSHINDGEDTFEMFLTKAKEIKPKKESLVLYLSVITVLKTTRKISSPKRDCSEFFSWTNYTRS